MARPRIQRLLPAAFAAVLLLGALLPASAGATTASASVVGGEGAVRGSFPYLAFVIHGEGGSAEACTGTVVSSNVVLTAAHCVVDEEGGTLYPASGFQVVTGSVRWSASERVVSSVSSVAVFPEYTPSGEYAHWGDAALLELSKPIAAPAVRLASAEAWAPGSAALITGWGKTASSQAGAASLLHDAETVVQPASVCGAGANHFHAEGQLCVADPEGARSACNGDSGGPLLVVAPGSASEPLEIGVASFIADAGCSPSSPQYYTRADLIEPWVAAQVAAVAPPPGQAPATDSAPAKLPRLGESTAERFVRTALRRDLGRRFERRSGYRVACEPLEAAKRSCKVSWDGGRFAYAGWVTVFYAFESNRAVWRHSYRVKSTVPRCAARRCRVQLFKG
ncbi:MAG TPA: serine protease [Solirubrobacterales bacterium]|jgi:secreted trypsin-like serine protease